MARQRSHYQIQRDVIYALLLREMGSRFGRSRVGFLWVMVEPLAHLIVPVAIFGFLRDRMLPGVEYPVPASMRAYNRPPSITSRKGSSMLAAQALNTWPDRPDGSSRTRTRTLTV